MRLFPTWAVFISPKQSLPTHPTPPPSLTMPQLPLEIPNPYPRANAKTLNLSSLCKRPSDPAKPNLADGSKGGLGSRDLAEPRTQPLAGRCAVLALRELKASLQPLEAKLGAARAQSAPPCARSTSRGLAGRGEGGEHASRATDVGRTAR